MYPQMIRIKQILADLVRIDSVSSRRFPALRLVEIAQCGRDRPPPRSAYFPFASVAAGTPDGGSSSLGGGDMGVFCGADSPS